MKHLFTFLFLLAVTFSASATRYIVQVSNYVYTPAQLTIQQGDTVRFQWISGSHPTESDNGAFTTFQMSSSAQVHDLVLPAGNFPYHCIPHQSMGMVGSITVNAVSAVPAFVIAEKVSVYPNPASEQITVAYSLDNIEHIKVTNMIGQQVRMLKPAFGQSENVQINVADLPKGIYFVNMMANGSTVYTKRFIKDR